MEEENIKEACEREISPEEWNINKLYKIMGEIAFIILKEISYKKREEIISRFRKEGVDKE